MIARGGLVIRLVTIPGNNDLTLFTRIVLPADIDKLIGKMDSGIVFKRISLPSLP